MAKPREGYHDLFAQVPEALWQALNEDAERNQRTATGQLIWLLRQQYPTITTPGAASSPTIAAGQADAATKPARSRPAKKGKK